VTLDLGFEGGTIVGPEGRRRAHLYVSSGRVAEISERRQAATRQVDAAGLLVMPGMVDAHVHLMEPGAPEREDFPTGTSAAARAGVTTIIEHTHGSPVRTVDDLLAKVERLRSRSLVDFGIGAHAWPGLQPEVGPLWRAGAAFFKVFTCTTHGVPGHSPGQLWRLFNELARWGAIALVHSEDESMAVLAEQALRADGREDGGVLSIWRSREGELVAIALVALLARLSRARIVVAHASHPGAVDIVVRERAAGTAIACETCPQYLTLYESEALDHGAFRKFTPPARARSRADLDAMWGLVTGRQVDFISTDHAPSTAEQKRSGSIWDVPFGLPGIDTTLAVLLDAAHAGRLSYELVTEIYSRAPARIYGLAPAKGSLDPGADADVVLVDPDARWVVSDAEIVSKAGWSPFSGRTLVGRAVATFLRGAPVARDGDVLGQPGDGRFVAGAGASR
jgi:dihydroorotase (multifunctional complex type)